MNFEAQLSELQDSLRRLEAGELSLDESLREYERGLKMLRACYDYLDKAERKIELLARSEDGKTERQDFQHEAWRSKE